LAGNVELAYGRRRWVQSGVKYLAVQAFTKNEGASRASGDTPSASGSSFSGAVARAQGLGLLLAGAALGTLLWGVTRPALWMDESVSAVATQRTWPNLWHLLHGAEAPLVPYYVVLKVTRAAEGLVPGAQTRPELMYRLPSVLAGVAAVWILTVWLARRWSVTLVLATGVALLTTGGFSRYGQEARPYALALLAAVISTVAWSRLIDDPRRRWIGLYAGSVVLLVVSHLLSGSLIAAHLIAALIAAPEPGLVWAQRRSAAVRTTIGAALGLLVVAPFAGWASTHGVGPARARPLTFDHLSSMLLNLFTEGAGLTDPVQIAPLLGIGALLVLAVVGLVQVFLQPYRFIARVAMAWALVPLLVLFPVLVVRPNLLMSRYLVFVLPGWAILTGLGVVTVADLVRRWSGPNLLVRTAAGSLVTVLLLTVMLLNQTETLTGVRALDGHSEDIRPALALADRPEYASLPLVVGTPHRATEISAYHRADEARLLGQRVPRDLVSIWPTNDELAARRQSRGHLRVVVLVRTPLPRSKCPRGSLKKYVLYCMPAWLRQEGYRVETAEKASYRWTFAVLVRTSTPKTENGLTSS
jgi:hypothetical protein